MKSYNIKITPFIGLNSFMVASIKWGFFIIYMKIFYIDFSASFDNGLLSTCSNVTCPVPSKDFIFSMV